MNKKHKAKLKAREAKEKEQFRKTNDELEYYSKSLIHYLSKQKMYDAKVWIQHADAIIDSRELVELKHNLIERRQHLRGRIESALQSIEIMKKDAMKQAQYMDDNGLQFFTFQVCKIFFYFIKIVFVFFQSSYDARKFCLLLLHLPILRVRKFMLNL